jgi:hypothetical protein
VRDLTLRLIQLVLIVNWIETLMKVIFKTIKKKKKTMEEKLIP